jgi:hypothetical protein
MTEYKGTLTWAEMKAECAEMKQKAIADKKANAGKPCGAVQKLMDETGWTQAVADANFSAYLKWLLN